MASEELKRYIKKCLERGFSESAVRMVAINSGWKKKEVDKVFEDSEIKAVTPKKPSKVKETEDKKKDNENKDKEKAEEMSVPSEEAPANNETGSQKEEPISGTQGSDPKQGSESKEDLFLKFYIGSNIINGFSPQAVKNAALKGGWEESQVDKLFQDEEIKAVISELDGAIPEAGTGFFAAPKDKEENIFNAARFQKPVMEKKEANKQQSSGTVSVINRRDEGLFDFLTKKESKEQDDSPSDRDEKNQTPSPGKGAGEDASAKVSGKEKTRSSANEAGTPKDNSSSVVVGESENAAQKEKSTSDVKYSRNEFKEPPKTKKEGLKEKVQKYYNEERSQHPEILTEKRLDHVEEDTDADPELKDYFLNQLMKGFGALAIKTAALDAGWSEEEIAKVFANKEVSALVSS
ncbi:MAG: hypothetical protein ACLFNR_02670 [Candidatus Paceibacterota bacterium]